MVLLEYLIQEDTDGMAGYNDQRVLASYQCHNSSPIAVAP